MPKIPRLNTLYKVQLKIILFTLPLILLGIIFWFGGELVTKKLLSRPYQALDKLQADLQPTIELKLNTLIINREIDQDEEFTRVEVETVNSGLKKLEFELPIKPSNPEEARLIQQLVISTPAKKLIAQFPVTLQVIKVEINKQENLSRIIVIAVNSLVTNLEFEFPVTEINIIESMLTEKLGISRQDIHKLIRYQIRR
jgi:hypothetical protein